MSKNKLYLNAKLNISKFDEEVKILSDEVRLDLFEKISNIHNDIGNYSYIKDLSNILIELSTKLNVSVAEIRLYNDNDTVSFTVFDGNKYEYVKFNPRKEKLEKIINKING
jgi:hypothetical protein